MNSDIIFTMILFLLCMFFAYKWKQEQLKTEHLQDTLRDKMGLLQTYKLLLDRRAKQTTRMQNELNKVDSVYHKLQKEVEILRKKNNI